jgi:hypothetical protein
MRQKLITALSLLIVFSVLFGTQIAATASAETKNGNPLTSPISFFQINGNISNRFFKFFSGSNSTHPAANVVVNAENILTHDVYSTTTDGNGNYTIVTEEKGLFFVKPQGGIASFYVPPVKPVNVKNPGSINNINFQGYVLP